MVLHVALEKDQMGWLEQRIATVQLQRYIDNNSTATSVNVLVMRDLHVCALFAQKHCKNYSIGTLLI